jgi:hypothetical protein
MAASRTILIFVGILPWLVPGCAAFRGEEIPQLGYVVKTSEPGTETACNELASLFAHHASLRINPYKAPVLPAGQYCDVTLIDTKKNHNDVSLLWDWQGIHIVVRQHGRLGLTTPNTETTQLADQLVEITKARYADAEVKPFKAYSNPFFGP